MFWDQYMPHVQMAAGKCSAWGAEVLCKLDAIHASMADGEVPNLQDKLLRIQTVVPAAGSLALDQVPMNQVWEVKTVSCSAAWRMNLNGALFLISTNSIQYGEAPQLMPGEVATIVAAASTEVTVLINRRTLPVKPHKAQSGPGNEQWTNGAGSKHESARDVLDVGPHPHRREAIVREN